MDYRRGDRVGCHPGLYERPGCVLGPSHGLPGGYLVDIAGLGEVDMWPEQLELQAALPEFRREWLQRVAAKMKWTPPIDPPVDTQPDVPSVWLVWMEDIQDRFRLMGVFTSETPARVGLAKIHGSRAFMKLVPLDQPLVKEFSVP